MRDLVKRFFFNSTKLNKILTGVSSGMTTRYDPKDRALHLLGLYEREIYGYMRKGMKPSSTLIDIGANDGYYGLAFIKTGGKDVVLCEPGGDERIALQENMSLNGFREGSDYILVDKFISDKSTQNEISINDLVQDRNNIFILMDIEGAEQKIMEGFDFKNTDEIIWLIETHSLEIEQRLLQIFKREGYKTHIIKNGWWRRFVPEKRPLSHNRWLYAEKK